MHTVKLHYCKTNSTKIPFNRKWLTKVSIKLQETNAEDPRVGCIRGGSSQHRPEESERKKSVRAHNGPRCVLSGLAHRFIVLVHSQVCPVAPVHRALQHTLRLHHQQPVFESIKSSVEEFWRDSYLETPVPDEGPRTVLPQRVMVAHQLRRQADNMLDNRCACENRQVACVDYCEPTWWSWPRSTIHHAVFLPSSIRGPAKDVPYRESSSFNSGSIPTNTHTHKKKKIARPSHESRCVRR